MEFVVSNYKLSVLEKTKLRRTFHDVLYVPGLGIMFS
jgi:hypothetical protein